MSGGDAISQWPLTRYTPLSNSPFKTRRFINAMRNYAAGPQTQEDGLYTENAGAWFYGGIPIHRLRLSMFNILRYSRNPARNMMMGRRCRMFRDKDYVGAQPRIGRPDANSAESP